jgi:membrane-bound lytic murein transglycosylase B
LCLAALLTGAVATWPAAAQPANPSKIRPDTAPGHYAQHPAALAFAREIDAQESWTDGWAERWIRQAQRHPQVIRLMTPAPAGTPRNWNVYRDRFIEPRRLQAGLRFWREHEATLRRAEQEFGVPAWLIVGIIGVETLYGQHTGTFRALDALATLAFDFPAEHPRAEQRSAFFRSELQALLRLSREQGVPPTVWLGSYAGAMGLPQFMPSNWMRYGVDYDGDGHIDLLNSPADAIGSVARYLQAFGWQSGMPTHYPVEFDLDRLALDALLAPSILPTFDAQTMASKGVRLPSHGREHAGPLALVELENGDPARGGAPRTYVAGTQNFYVITRYNQSSYYAMAVIELGQAVEALWRQR